MSDPCPTSAHNSNVILFCPKCQCKWKSSQKWRFEKGGCHLAAMCDPFLVSNFYVCSHNRYTLHPAVKTSRVCSHSAPTRISLPQLKQDPQHKYQNRQCSWATEIIWWPWGTRCCYRKSRTDCGNKSNNLIKVIFYGLNEWIWFTEFCAFNLICSGKTFMCKFWRVQRLLAA